MHIGRLPSGLTPWRPFCLLIVAALPALVSAQDLLPIATEEVLFRTEPTSDDGPRGLQLSPDAQDEAESGVPAVCPSSSGRTWVDAQYLLWWFQGNPMPPLLTTSPANTQRDDAGVLGAAGTEILLGGDRIDGNTRPGGRLRFGFVRDDCGWGLDGEFVALGDGANTQYVTPLSSGTPILARPVINTDTGLEDAQLFAYPDLAEGRMSVATSGEFYSAAALLRKCFCEGPNSRVDLLAGYRFLRLRDELAIRENFVSRDPGGVIEIGTQIDVSDDFDAQNEFHGCELGVDAVFSRGPWTLDVLGKLALGNVHQSVDISGQTRVTTPDPNDVPTDRPGGLLALPSNMGGASRDEFGVLPELGVTLRWELCPSTSLTCGYTLFLLTHIVRSGDQIDRQIDPSQLSPLLNVPNAAPDSAARPAAIFDDTTFWAQGVSIGLHFCR